MTFGGSANSGNATTRIDPNDCVQYPVSVSQATAGEMCPGLEIPTLVIGDLKDEVVVPNGVSAQAWRAYRGLATARRTSTEAMTAATTPGVSAPAVPARNASASSDSLA